MSRGDPGRILSQADLVTEIARIGFLDAAALKPLWPTWFGKPPPARTRRDMLALALAYRIQSNAPGGLPKLTVRTLDAVAAREFGGTAARTHDQSQRLRPGTRLVREWHGVVHDVAVVEDGFVWNGERYRSLSAVAQAITGTHWNGEKLSLKKCPLVGHFRVLYRHFIIQYQRVRRWRRGWDSNPRWAFTHAGFQDRCLKPLGHPSSACTAEAHGDVLTLAALRGQVSN